MDMLQGRLRDAGAETVHPESETTENLNDLTNVFHFTLKGDEPVPEVIPRSYQGNPPPGRHQLSP